MSAGRRTEDRIGLEVIAGFLRSACDEMGAVLVRASYSPNIKERRDCSTALFDARGELVMQAAQIPVHLGSMPDAVGAVLGETHREGDLWILNDPFRGGTHLPDLTAISPAFDSEGDLLGFVANRAHHADIGGPTPGGMPANSSTLEEEGIVIPPTRADEATLTEIAERTRQPAERLADLRAQLAANRTGLSRLEEARERFGDAELRVGMAAILDYSERRMRAAIEGLDDGSIEVEDFLDAADGSAVRLRLRLEVSGEEMRFDFTGTDDQVAGNLNCPASVTRAACLYAVRVACDPDAPPSAGSWRPVLITIPDGAVLSARPPAAVAAGNVETSSRVADLALRALGAFTDVPADGQGTMNNLTLSGEGFTYYETIGGGQGACAESDGPSAVHVAMSNTLNTPVEALESELPVRVRQLAVRRGSGGDGLHRGGDGIVRELEALEPMLYTLIGERRGRAPRGRNRGEDGKPGADFLNGERIPAKSSGHLDPGDRLRIETPGGGGQGEPGRRPDCDE